VGTGGCEVNSSKGPGRRFAKTARSGNFPLRLPLPSHNRSFPNRYYGGGQKLTVRISVVLMKQKPYEVREKVQSAPLTQEETVPQGTTRRLREPAETDNC